MIRGTGKQPPPNEFALMRQRWGNGCGFACLASILTFHDLQADRHLAESRRSTSLFELHRTAQQFGLHPQALHLAYTDLIRITLPAIAHLRGFLGGGHYVVVYRWTPTLVSLADPATGLQAAAREHFEGRWSGYLLELRPPASWESLTQGEDQRLSAF